MRSDTTVKSSVFDGKPDANTNVPSCNECNAFAKSARDEPVSRMLVNANREICICIVFGLSRCVGASMADSIIT